VQGRTQSPEPFASADVAARHLGVTRRMLLAMARMGIPGAYPVGTGSVRRRWIFLISELTSSVRVAVQPDPSPERQRHGVQGITPDYDR